MIRADCVYFRGDKPCQFKIICENCSHYKPFSERILVIKCAAQGDVLRTTALLPGLKRKYPDSHITWVAEKESLDLLKNNPLIDRVLSYDWKSLLPLLVESFDVLISLDKEPIYTSAATKVKAAHKLGFGMNDSGALVTLNKNSEYAYRLGVDDDLKFVRNQKTYQEIIYEAAEIEYKNDPYVLHLKEKDKTKAMEFFRKQGIGRDRPAVGLNTGAGIKFETKQWPLEYYLKLIEYLHEQLKTNVFLLGGEREIELNQALEEKAKYPVFNTGNNNSLMEFAGFLSLMDLVVSSDTLGMHIAIALGRKIVALFGPTCPQEIDLYGQGAKLFADVHCAPCYRQACDDGKCMTEIMPEQVLTEIQKLI